MGKPHRKPIKYYIDFENVHGAGLKGVDALDEHDVVIIIYSQAAETFHIEHAIDILKSKARVEFVEVDGGTRNAADFQLIVALFGAMDDAFEYVIVSGDTGFDAAIKMGERMGLPTVTRFANIRGDIEVEKTEKPKSRRSRRGRSGRDSAAGTEPQPQELQVKDDSAASEAQDQAQSEKQAETPGPSAPEEPAKDAEQQTDNQPEGQAASPKRRTRRRKRSNGSQDGQAAAQAETAQQVSEDASDEATSKAREEARQDTAAARARAAEAMKLALAKPAKAAENAAVPKAASPESEATPNPDKQDATALVEALLAEKGVELSDAQLATVVSALDGASGRQDFYRRIIKIERQQKGRALYRQVREHYSILMEGLQNHS